MFDSKLTTYANLNELNNMDIDFITLRRRSDKILEQLRQTPGSAWRQIQLSNVSRAFRTPKVLERMIQLRDYEVPIRQLAGAETKGCNSHTDTDHCQLRIGTTLSRVVTSAL